MVYKLNEKNIWGIFFNFQNVLEIKKKKKEGQIDQYMKFVDYFCKSCKQICCIFSNV